MVDDGDIEVVYATYHVDVGETPFFVAVDYDRQKIVISIRGTLSMKVKRTLNTIRQFGYPTRKTSLFFKKPSSVYLLSR